METNLLGLLIHSSRVSGELLDGLGNWPVGSLFPATGALRQLTDARRAA